MDSVRVHRTVLDGFDEAVAEDASRIAVTCGGQSLTYRELDERANLIAWRLRELGAGAETVVGICLPRGLNMAVAVLAVLKAGGGYLPLEPEHPDERICAMLADAGAAALLADVPRRDRLALAGWAKPTVIPGEDTSATAPGSVAGPGNLQYVIYTSGSTGRPKGIAMQHGPQITLLEWSRRRYQEQPVALQYFPITTDVASLELFSAWWAGGQVVIATEADRYDVCAVAGLIRTHSVTKVLLPVVTLHELARHAVDHPADVQTLRELISTGDRLAITPELRLMCGRLTGSYLDDQYGSTEVNVVTAPRLTEPCEQWPDRPLVGTPIAAARIYVIDDRLIPSPPNVPGEICVGGIPPARGYTGNGALTAASFVPDPFSPEPGARMYRTGDLGRWRARGTLECLGRIDFQIKLRGHRIEPGEIETLLRAREDVKDAVVTVAHLDAPAGEGDDILVAYVVHTAAGADHDTYTEVLRGYLVSRLPAHMIPQAFVFLAELPVNGNGKVDRLSLPAPESAQPPFAPPRDEVESTIATAWAESLGIDNFGVKDNFFWLGGHSLLATRIIYQLRESLGVELPLAALFRSPTVESLAAEARRLLPAEA